MSEEILARPFLKWAGGKTQLLSDIKKLLPQKLITGNFTYIEPFVGSGAVLFRMLGEFPNMRKAIVNDLNKDLIETYKTIATRTEELIAILEVIQNEYYRLDKNQDKKKEYYYKKRRIYNERKTDSVTHSALFIFLNRTCFNGLYRVNRKNEFNVPIGRYSRPKICDGDNLRLVSKALKKVTFLCGDFEKTLKYARPETLFYLDPPYKPLSQTSSFNAYSKHEFDDSEQIRLRDFCVRLDSLNYSWILSNSDVANEDSKNNFFDELYSDFTILRVNAKRVINSKPGKRGPLTELLIVNQPASG